MSSSKRFPLPGLPGTTFVLNKLSCLPISKSYLSEFIPLRFGLFLGPCLWSAGQFTFQSSYSLVKPHEQFGIFLEHVVRDFFGETPGNDRAVLDSEKVHIAFPAGERFAVEDRFGGDLFHRLDGTAARDKRGNEEIKNGFHGTKPA